MFIILENIYFLTFYSSMNSEKYFFTNPKLLNDSV